MAKRALRSEEMEIAKKVAQAVTERNPENIKAAFVEFKLLCSDSILPHAEDCPNALFGVETTFSRLGLYMGSDEIPEIINFDALPIGAAAHHG